MAKYRKKPVVIEASQWFKDGDHPAVIAKAKGHTGLYVVEDWQSQMRKDGFPYGVDYVVVTLNGPVVVVPGEWIVTGVKGETYLCKPDIFTETYELA